MNAAIENYFRAARDAGCPADTVQRLLTAGIVLQPVQLQASAAARDCDRPCNHRYDLPCTEACAPVEVGFGGARGGGKSFWGMAQILDDSLRCPGLKSLVLRKIGKAGRENFDDLRRQMFMAVPHEYKRQEGVLVFKNESRIVLGHFKDERDIDNYLGLSYDDILVEEATTLSYSKYRDIKTCNRTSRPNWRPRTYSTTNPGGIGHQWYRELFVDPWMANREAFSRFVPATVYDNRFINANYRHTLEALTGWQRRAWLDGDWDIAVGQFFTNFRRDVHVLDEPIREIPLGWKVWASFDYGFTHYSVCHLFAQSTTGDVYCLAEHAERRWLIPRHAEAIKAMLARFGLEPHHLHRFVAGADCFNKERNGGCVADDFAEQGLHFSSANNDRISGAAEVLARLGDVDASPPIAPTLFFNPECRGIITTLPLLQHDPNRPEDVEKVDCDNEGRGGDDFYDSARYGVMYAARKKPGRSMAGPAPVAPTMPAPASGSGRILVSSRAPTLPPPRF